MSTRRDQNNINAGSMADIAFLLLIFFLVSTTLSTDIGLSHNIPKKTNTLSSIKVNDNNLLAINLNLNNELMVNQEQVELHELKQIVVDFIDNGAGLSALNKSCDYCKGKRDSNSSDHPTKAIIEIDADKTASYELYISVLDHINSAYKTLRNRYAMQYYGVSFSSLESTLLENPKDLETLKKVITTKEKYPLLLSDSQYYN